MWLNVENACTVFDSFISLLICSFVADKWFQTQTHERATFWNKKYLFSYTKKNILSANVFFLNQHIVTMHIILIINIFTVICHAWYNLIKLVQKSKSFHCYFLIQAGAVLAPRLIHIWPAYRGFDRWLKRCIKCVLF